jgi:hypothetical protein
MNVESPMMNTQDNTLMKDIFLVIILLMYAPIHICAEHAINGRFRLRQAHPNLFRQGIFGKSQTVLGLF